MKLAWVESQCDGLYRVRKILRGSWSGCTEWTSAWRKKATAAETERDKERAAAELREEGYIVRYRYCDE